MRNKTNFDGEESQTDQNFICVLYKHLSSVCVLIEKKENE